LGAPEPPAQHDPVFFFSFDPRNSQWLPLDESNLVSKTGFALRFGPKKKFTSRIFLCDVFITSGLRPGDMERCNSALFSWPTWLACLPSNQSAWIFSPLHKLGFFSPSFGDEAFLLRFGCRSAPSYFRGTLFGSLFCQSFFSAAADAYVLSFSFLQRRSWSSKSCFSFSFPRKGRLYGDPPLSFERSCAFFPCMMLGVPLSLQWTTSPLTRTSSCSFSLIFDFREDFGPTTRGFFFPPTTARGNLLSFSFYQKPPGGTA